MKKPTVCFVCYDGIGCSALFKFWFEEYLDERNLKTIDVINVGVETNIPDFPIYNAEHAKLLKNSDYVVLTYTDLTERLKIYKPKGKIMTMEKLYKKAGWTKEKEGDTDNKSSVDSAFTILVDEIYEDRLSKAKKLNRLAMIKRQLSKSPNSTKSYSKISKKP